MKKSVNFGVTHDASRAPRSRDVTVLASIFPSFTSRLVMAPDVRPCFSAISRMVVPASNSPPRIP
ncbi:MAG: hypothetical protein ACXW5U_19910 [Thermoanaerobaculia bacterium]